MAKKSKKINFSKILLIIIGFSLLFFLLKLVENPPDVTTTTTIPKIEPDPRIYLLGSNLGVWGEDDYWIVNEPYIKSEVQRHLSKGVIGSFRWGIRDISDEGLLLILDTVKENGALPLIILNPNNDDRAIQVVQLYGDRVTYYEYGNEVDWFFDMQPEEHADRMCAAIPKLKKINPNIKIGGPAQGGTDVAFMERWANRMRQTCPDVYPDFISYHKYFAYSPDTEEQILNKIPAFGDEIEMIRTSMNNIFDRDLPYIVSEWNYHAAPELYAGTMGWNETFMREFTNGVLDELISHDVFMAHQYSYGCGGGDHKLDMVNWYSDTGIVNQPKPQYWVFRERAIQTCPDCYRTPDPCAWNNC